MTNKAIVHKYNLVSDTIVLKQYHLTRKQLLQLVLEDKLKAHSLSKLFFKRNEVEKLFAADKSENCPIVISCHDLRLKYALTRCEMAKLITEKKLIALPITEEANAYYGYKAACAVCEDYLASKDYTATANDKIL